MQRTVGGAIAVLFAVVAFAGGGAAQEAAGRFALAPDGEGFLRLDTQTGAVSYCRLLDGRWTCEAADTGDLAGAVAAINERLGVIEAELAALRDIVGAPPAADQTVTNAIAALTARIDAALATPPAADMTPVLAELQTLGERVDVIAAAPAGALPAIALQPVLDAIDGLVARVDALAATPAPGSGEVALETLAAEIRTLTQQVEALGNPVPAAAVAEEALAPLRAEIAALADRVVELGDALAALPAAAMPPASPPAPADANALIEVGERLAALEQEIAALGAPLTDPALMAAMRSLGADIAAVQAAVAAIAPAPSPDPAITARLASIESRLAALTVAVSAVRQPSAAPPPALDELRTGIAAVAGQVTALAGVPAAIADLAARIDAVAAQQQALAVATSPGIAPTDLAAVAQSLRDELALLGAEVDRLGALSVNGQPDLSVRLAAIESAMMALGPAAAAATGPLREAIAGLAADVGVMRQAAERDETPQAIADLARRIAALEIAVTALAPHSEAEDIAAGAELRGTGVEPEPTTFADELRRRLFDLGAALRRGLGG